MKRSCGECTACCKHLGIGDLEPPKLPNVWCQYCNIGKGCGIYDKRPESCRLFECLWLQDQKGNLGEDLRPDRCKVMLITNPEGKTVIAFVNPETPVEWRKPKILQFLKNVAFRNRKPCFAWAGKRCWAIMPNGTDQLVPEDCIIRGENGAISINIKSSYKRGKDESIQLAIRS